MGFVTGRRAGALDGESENRRARRRVLAHGSGQVEDRGKPTEGGGVER